MAKNNTKALCAIGVFLLLCPPALADESAETLFSADSVEYNSTTNTITATGTVTLARPERQMTADSLTYNHETGRVAATGNITLRETSGETLYADSADIQEDLSEGTLDNILIRLADDSRFVAADAKREENNLTRLNDAAFTPCTVCEGETPFWSLSARDVEHDQRAQRVRYRDVFLEVYDVPVLYLPYFQHADPSVKRESGFLAPTFARSTNRGSMVQAPFYWTLSPHRDVTVTPIITSKSGQLGLVDYREHFGNGVVDINGSIGHINKLAAGKNTGDYGTRAHINAAAAMDINQNWRSRLTLERATGQNYLRRFDLDRRDVLTTDALAERFGRNSYASLRAMSFQSQRVGDDNDAQPHVIPEIFVAQSGRYTPLDVNWTVDGGTAVLERRLGASSRRGSLNAQADWSSLNRLGGILTLESRLQNDVYSVEDVTRALDTYSGSLARSIPQAAATYRHPFIRRGSAFSQLIEPMVSISATPTAVNDARIPNEDSQVFEFDDANLFRLNRFTGSDRVSEGSRIDYGVNAGLFYTTEAKANFFIGQSYQIQKTDGFVVGSGLEKRLSDVVGRLSTNYQNLADLTYRFRIDQDSSEFRRHDATFTVNTAPIQWSAAYLFLDEQANQALNILNTERREEVSGRASLLLSDEWVLSGSVVRDIADDSTRFSSVGLSYFLDCIAFNLDFERDFTTDGTLPRETRVFFRLNFKHLGDDSVQSYLRDRNRLTGRSRSLRDYFDN